MEYNCTNSLICSINCASDGNIDTNTAKIIPFNNYGDYYLRIKVCLNKVHSERYSKYSYVQQVPCLQKSDYQICNRFIPPKTFVPVALPINTTYIEIDSCETTGRNGTYNCKTSNPAPVRVYGTKFLFPTSYDVAQTNTSTCNSNGE